MGGDTSATTVGAGGGAGGGDVRCGALELDGIDDFVSVPHDAALNLSVMTIEAWVMPASYMHEVQVLSHHDHENRDGYVLLMYGNSEMQFRLYRNSGGDVAVGNGVVSAGQWHHVAATYDGDHVRMYVDGVQVNQNQVGDVQADDYDGLLTIGRASYADSFHFHGVIDEVRLSRVARYVESNLTLPAKAFEVDADTVALWHFDGDGQEVVDATGNHNGHLGLGQQLEGTDPKRVDVPCIGDIVVGR